MTMLRCFTGGSMLVLNGGIDPDGPIPQLEPVPVSTDQVLTERAVGLPQVRGFSVEYQGKLKPDFGVNVDETQQQ